MQLEPALPVLFSLNRTPALSGTAAQMNDEKETRDSLSSQNAASVALKLCGCCLFLCKPSILFSHIVHDYMQLQ